MSEVQEVNAPICVYCGMSTNGKQLLVVSDAAGGPIHENECWQAYMKTPEYEARNAATVAAFEAHVAWKNKGMLLGSQRKELISGFCHLQFDAGDWLADGEDNGFVSVTNYAKAEMLCGYKVSCLRKFALIARRVPKGIRVPSLPWAAHQAVAYLKDPEHRTDVLKRAAENNWSVRDVRHHINTLAKDVVPETTREHDTELREGHAALARERLDEWSRALSSPDIGDELMAVLPQLRNPEKLVARLKATAALLLKYAESVESFQPPAQVQEAEVVTA